MRLGLAVPLFVLVGCKDGALPDFNIFSVEDDIALGAELAIEIESNPQEYGQIVDPSAYSDAYGHLERIRDEILASGEVAYAEEFAWEVHLIDDDEVLNAFCAPGGYIYVYTGLMRYLETEDHFAGVMGHEIAHAANRHSTEQLTKAYGIATLIDIVLGDGTAGQIADIAAGLASLEFSRDDETEADESSVYYLCETEWAADGAAGFFRKLQEEGGYDIPEFLSTHPSDDARIADIEGLAAELGCSTELSADADWQAVLDSLP